jgi:hypothetical protein
MHFSKLLKIRDPNTCIMVVWEGSEGLGSLCGKEEQCSCLAVPPVHAKLLYGGSVALQTSGFVVVATRVPVNHGVIHQNKIGELQHTLRWRNLKFKRKCLYYPAMCVFCMT